MHSNHQSNILQCHHERAQVFVFFLFSDAVSWVIQKVKHDISRVYLSVAIFRGPRHVNFRTNAYFIGAFAVIRFTSSCINALHSCRNLRMSPSFTFAVVSVVTLRSLMMPSAVKHTSIFEDGLREVSMSRWLLNKKSMFWKQECFQNIDFLLSNHAVN